MTTDTPEKEPKKGTGFIKKALAAIALGLGGLGLYVEYGVYEESKPHDITITLTERQNDAFLKGDQCVTLTLRSAFSSAAINYIEAEGLKDISRPLNTECAPALNEGSADHNIAITVPGRTYSEFIGTFREAFNSKDEAVDLIASLLLLYGLSEDYNKAIDTAKTQPIAKQLKKKR